ncbi:NHLP family bacteriocin export ABC transporter peptidase/permease/ATPase subunit [Oscillatoria sp. FACHB-1407]|uniref:NHLP family bacteriocin export ABC transporter peptidase/permease/ATPase subunit n=1 Tax=Oscillatoria sp. FACHB-1407 TaxID=2692847 RepID=UPI001688D66D|nr:NHLP family bacteriocin export ABC transporter peptidase/permease/ATPase subunit [Oscillatoria sp. FACHB-1407]MBD2462685.1 NHLP family bacteriocin export ABC transporter peptidase/permease/ATPase subunit [Oscillatoria sp. FACHB-1407]
MMWINSFKPRQRKPKVRSLEHKPVRVKTPTVLQMEAVECGAACLGMMLGYYGRYVPLAELRQACGVSRDGVTAANILKAARNYGLVAKGFKKSLDSLQQLRPPFVVFWHFNHFLVVDGFGRDRVYLNNPAAGPMTVSYQDFDEGYTGVVLVMEPGTDFQPGGSKPSVVNALSSRLKGSTGALLYCVLAGFLLVIPTLALPIFTQMFVDQVLIADRLDWLPYILVGVLLAIALQGLLTLLQLRYLRSLKIKLAVSLSSRFLWHVLRLPMHFYAQRFAGEISSRVRLNDDIADVLSGRLTTTVISVVLVVFYAIAMLQYDTPLTLIVVFFAALNVLILQWVSRQRIDANLRLAQEYGKVSGVAIAGLQSMETLKASGLESDFFARWAGYYTKAINAQQDLGMISKVLGVMPALLSALTALSLLAIGGWRVIHGNLSIGMLVAFQMLTQSFLLPVNRLVRFGSTIQDLQGNLQRLDDVLSNEVDSQLISHVTVGEVMPPSSMFYAASPTHRLKGYIEIKDVTYGYNPLEPPLIENFNLSIKPGQRIALVGGSGSGKSTLAKVIAGLFEPWSGEIYFDGIPRRQIPRSVLTNSIAVVEQDILLFAGSVRDNLTLWDTTVPDAALRRACQDAAIEDVILAMMGGYDAALLEGATNLSGGQRQRLELARALVNHPSIVIMDEATSALDTEAERAIDLKLRQRGCTCLIVAHRLSTIRDCDEIIVLERGKVVQRGTHEELWHQPGYYAQLIQSEGALS